MHPTENQARELRAKYHAAAVLDLRGAIAYQMQEAGPEGTAERLAYILAARGITAEDLRVNFLRGIGGDFDTFDYSNH